MLNLRVATPEQLADLRHLPGYAGVAVSGDTVRIGAGTTHAAIEDGAVSGRLGAILAGVARRIAYRAVRNRGTLGGSLAHADPAADWVAVLSAFPGFALALGPQGERRIPLAGFVPGVMETALRSDELLAAVELPVLPEATRWGHWKFCRKPGEFSKATACVLALPGAAPRAVLAALDAAPLVIPDASALLAAPETEADRIVAGLALDDPWRAALARTALRRAVEQVA
jgi:carbon-monoxide dehydrogenase medium subunit